MAALLLKALVLPAAVLALKVEPKVQDDKETEDFIKDFLTDEKVHDEVVKSSTLSPRGVTYPFPRPSDSDWEDNLIQDGKGDGGLYDVQLAYDKTRTQAINGKYQEKLAWQDYEEAKANVENWSEKELVTRKSMTTAEALAVDIEENISKLKEENDTLYSQLDWAKEDVEYGKKAISSLGETLEKDKEELKMKEKELRIAKKKQKRKQAQSKQEAKKEEEQQLEDAARGKVKDATAKEKKDEANTKNKDSGETSLKDATANLVKEATNSLSSKLGDWLRSGI
eukprot:TRINITY_DN18709_c0_g1_i1.p1 TRINITY_DN18709_c0_g1~~TRINITY_DN18709_c0_g1_i1.p1  ORF type:complete len:282 (-),score=84.96 TRINITY_DN18709_c0_g1_i1:59-904(-)